MREDVVSVVVPCYNGDDFIDRFFRMMFEQTYNKIQLIIVNDGSTDNTEEKLELYQKKIENCGMEYKHVKKENGGQASAINEGLKYVEGEYMMWFDIDDIMESRHIEKKVHYLQQNPHCDVVMCRGYILDESDLENPIATIGEEEAVGSLFEDILLEHRRCQPGLYMVRTESLFLKLNRRRIYESKCGQNLQLLLPITLEDKVGYVKDILYSYVVREKSHSHSYRGGMQLRERLDDIYDAKMHVLKELSITKEYFDFLAQQVELNILLRRVDCIDREVKEHSVQYVSDICKRYIKWKDIETVVGKREIYIWGYCKSSRNLKENLEMYTSIKCRGYIESDYKKVAKTNGYEVLHRSMINQKNMYIIIPLNYHEDIMDVLSEKGFKDGDDFFYPKSDLRNRFKGEKIQQQYER